MAIFRLLFSAALAFFGAVSMFMGAVMMIATAKSGTFQVTWGTQTRDGARQVALADNATEFWMYFGAFGVAPVILGGLVMLYGRRLLRG